MKPLTGPDILVSIGGVLAAVGVFLPWATVGTTFGNLSINGMDVVGSDAVLVLGVGIITAIPGRWLPWRTPASPLSSVLLGLILIALAYLEASTLRPTGAGVSVTIGAGLWAAGIGGALAILGGIGRQTARGTP